MTNIYKISNPIITTNKVKSLIDLDKNNLLVPKTVICDSQVEPRRVVSIIKSWRCDWLYVRINYSDTVYPHYIYLLSNLSDVEYNIDKLIFEASNKNIQRYDFLIQPLLEFAWSGAILIKDKYIFIEIVSGAPNALFRKGYFKYRCLLNQDYDIVAEENGRQPICINWQNGQWKESLTSLEQYPIKKYINHLKKIDLSRNLIYEVGVYHNNTYFLESKSIPKFSYLDISHGNICKPFRIYQEPRDKPFVNKIILEYPLFDDIYKINHDAIIILKNGAYLSHFAYAMAQNGIECVFE